jgi:hypothetical protein
MAECCGFVTTEAVDEIKRLMKESGLPFLGIAISHPHWYTSSTTWARALGCKVYTSVIDKEWWMRSDSVDDVVVWWTGKTSKLGNHATMIHCGGAFAECNRQRLLIKLLGYRSFCWLGGDSH